MIIDAWGQHPTLRHSQDPVFDSLRRWTKEAAPETDIPVAITVASMDQAGVDFMLSSAWYAPGNVMISNDEVAQFVSESSGRLIGIAGGDYARPMDAIREIRRAITELGFKGVRIIPWLWQAPPTDRRFYPIYALCCELGVPFCTQIGHTGPLMPSEPGRPIYLDQVALDFPELTIIAGHIGYPWTEEAIAIATKHENVFIDTSAYTVTRYPRELVRYIQGHGRHKILFGTNYPMMTAAKALQGLEQLGLDEEASALFLGGNAARIFGIAS